MLSQSFLGDPSKVIRELDYCHPKAYPVFRKLEQYLITQWAERKAPRLFLPFETYRTPTRQEWLLSHTTSTKAPPWSSAHQYGLAVDYVPYVDNKWSWNEDASVWRFLADAASKHGLRVPYSWDKVHVEHPLFIRIRAVLTAA